MKRYGWHSSYSAARAHPWARPPILGAAFGIILVLGTILVGARGFLAFYSFEGLLIVGGGVWATAAMSFEAADVRAAWDSLRHMFEDPDKRWEKAPADELKENMRHIVAWARVVKEKGLAALESQIGRGGVDDPFIKYGLNMVVSEYTADEVRGMMETAADARMDRAAVPVDVLDSMASHAPAFGMVGTLVGMIIMLSRLSGDDMSAVGASLAVAFLSTLYGVMSARMLYIPAATRLRAQVEQSRFRDQLIVEGMTMLAAGKQPMQVQDRLNSFLRPENHDYFNVFVGHRTAAEPQAYRYAS